MSKRDIIEDSARVAGWLRRIAGVAAITAAFGAGLVIPGGRAEGQPRPAQVINTDSPKAIPGRYIVVFRESEGVAGAATTAVRRGEPRDRLAAGRSREAQALVQQLGGRVELAYEAALTGFSAELTPQALEALRTAPGVAWIEADQVTSGDTIQNNPPRGLDRTSERPLPLDNRFTYSVTGAGVTAYVIDSGIRASHNEFGGRASAVFTAIMDGGGTNDCHGHGTHVAGTIGGATFGVAKEVNIVAVRVLDCTNLGTVSGAVAGVNWVTANAVFPISGTSMAAPHVTGVAALILQVNAAATPAQVLAAIHNAANVASTPGWGGIVNPGVGSPNELLHWGSALRAAGRRVPDLRSPGRLRREADVLHQGLPSRLRLRRQDLR